MRKRIVMAVVVLATLPLLAKISPQGGVNLDFGSNSLAVYQPWAGVNFSLTDTLSLSFQYTFKNFNFLYFTDKPVSVPGHGRHPYHGNKTSPFPGAVPESEKVSFNQISADVGLDNDRLAFNTQFSLLFGSNGYKGYALDAEVDPKLNSWLSLQTGVYYLREDSILWFPDEPNAKLYNYTLRGGFIFQLIKDKFYLNPLAGWGKLSGDVNHFDYGAELTLVPKDPLYLTVRYTHYHESGTKYTFSGDYISGGIAVYF